MGRLMSFAVAGLLVLALAAGSVAADPFGGTDDRVGSITTHWMKRSGLVAGALSAMNRGDTERVIRLAEQAMELPLAPMDRLAALNSLCVGYTIRGTPGVALEYCNRVVRQSHSDWRALNNRANAYLRLGRVERAINDYQLAMFRLEGIGQVARVRHYGSVETHDGFETVSANLDLARRRLYQDIQYAAARSLVTLR